MMGKAFLNPPVQFSPTGLRSGLRAPPYGTGETKSWWEALLVTVILACVCQVSAVWQSLQGALLNLFTVSPVWRIVPPFSHGEILNSWRN